MRYTGNIGHTRHMYPGVREAIQYEMRDTGNIGHTRHLYPGVREV